MKGKWKAVVLVVVLASSTAVQAQRVRGELRIQVRDPQGVPVASSAELISEVNQFRREFQIAASGEYAAQDLPFGVYRLRVSSNGFVPWTAVINVRSEVPVHLAVVLGIAPVQTQVDVNDSATLLDPNRTGTQYSIGAQALAETVPTQPGREVSDLVDDLPGWLYEANGVLHPRGSEYDVQYVVNGTPVTENRSLTFAPIFNVDNVEAMRVLTANYPAEYGRKLGGVIEVTTQTDPAAGLHSSIDGEGGSFATAEGSARFSYGEGHNYYSVDGYGAHSGRYLDPPVLENFTNVGNADGISGSYERQVSGANRVRISVTRDLARYLVPNYLVQEGAGQRQNVSNAETAGEISFQHVISNDVVFSASGSVRDATAQLRSNAFSTPVIAAQKRGYREGYVRADIAGHHGKNDWKVGIDSIFNPVYETLQYAITNPAQFDPGTQVRFHFADHRWDTEPSAYAEDELHAGNWNLSAGLRLDYYGFVVHESAWSPRIGVSRYFHSANFLVHASYDRVFQTPAMENLLLASSPLLDSLNPLVVRLPVRPAHANYYEIGITKSFFGSIRLDADVFRRDFRDYPDDDVLLDTGVSFPISFTAARIVGEEVRIEIPHWRRLSGFLSYSNQSGIGHGPVTGGLFLGSDAIGVLSDTSKFAISQDQRNTARARVRLQASKKLWIASGGEYGSGLPADVGDSDFGLLLAQYGPAIVSRVNLPRSRLRPNFSFDAAAGIDLYRKEQRSASFEIQCVNLLNRLNVINFESLFSGTAIAPPRSVSARLRVSF